MRLGRLPSSLKRPVADRRARQASRAAACRARMLQNGPYLSSSSRCRVWWRRSIFPVVVGEWILASRWSDPVLPADPVERHLHRHARLVEPAREHLPIVRKHLLGHPVDGHRLDECPADRAGPGPHLADQTPPRIRVEERWATRRLWGGGLPRPDGGSPTGAAPHAGQLACTRRSLARAVTPPPGPRLRNLTGPSSAPGILSPRKDHRQGCASSLSNAMPRS